MELHHHHDRLAAYYAEEQRKHWEHVAAAYWQRSLGYDQTPLPNEPESIIRFRTGDHHGFCRAIGIPCLPYCPLCESESGGGDEREDQDR